MIDAYKQAFTGNIIQKHAQRNMQIISQMRKKESYRSQDEEDPEQILKKNYMKEIKNAI